MVRYPAYAPRAFIAVLAVHACCVFFIVGGLREGASAATVLHERAHLPRTFDGEPSMDEMEAEVVPILCASSACLLLALCLSVLLTRWSVPAAFYPSVLRPIALAHGIVTLGLFRGIDDWRSIFAVCVPVSLEWLAHGGVVIASQMWGQGGTATVRDEVRGPRGSR